MSSAPDPADFVRRFAEWWRDPAVERLDTVLAADAVLIQPFVPPSQGRDRAMAEFEQLFGLIPDLRAEVHRWAADGDLVFIEFTLSGTFAGRAVSWDAVDRFFLRDGHAVERVSYFDSMPLAIQMGLKPRGWPRLVRSRLRPAMRPVRSSHNSG